MSSGRRTVAAGSPARRTRLPGRDHLLWHRHAAVARSSGSAPTRARRSRCAAGSPPGARAASCTSSRCATAPASSSASMVKNDVPAGACSRAPTTCRRRSSLEVTGTVRADARAPIGYELGVTRPRASCTRRAPSTRSRPRSTAPPSCWTTATSGCARARQHAILRIRAEVIRACRDYFDAHGFSLFDAPIFTPAACEGTTTLFAVDVLRRDGVPDAERPALRRGRRAGVRQGVLLRPDLPRREVEDAPPPDRVLDGRARGGLRWTSTTTWTSPRTSSSHIVAARARAPAAPSSRCSSATSRRSSACRSRSRASPTPRRSSCCGGKGVDVAWGDDFGADEETALSQQFDRPVHGAPLPARSARPST